MKSYIFRVTCAVVLFLAACTSAAAMEPDASPREQRAHDREERYVERWNKLIPRYSKIQFAGGMGLVSIGTGWDYGKKKQWETDIFLGILPRFSGSKTTATMTLKQNFIPWDIHLWGPISFEPLTMGLFVNTIFSRDFWGREPEKYGGSYYKFATNTRFSAFVGQRVKLITDSRRPWQSISLFYEISSCDLYIISAFTNKSLKPRDYLVLSFGLKFQILR